MELKNYKQPPISSNSSSMVLNNPLENKPVSTPSKEKSNSQTMQEFAVKSTSNLQPIKSNNNISQMNPQLNYMNNPLSSNFNRVNTYLPQSSYMMNNPLISKDPLQSNIYTNTNNNASLNMNNMLNMNNNMNLNSLNNFNNFNMLNMFNQTQNANLKNQNKNNSKTYSVKVDGEKYNLNIECNNIYFYFKLEPASNLILSYYKGEFNLSSVINKLNVIISNHNAFEQLNKIVEKAINDDSIKIVKDKMKKKMIIRFNKNLNDYSSDFELDEVSNKKKLFNNIFEELNLLKLQQMQYMTLFKSNNFLSHKDAINLINENNSKNDFENKINNIDNICKSQKEEINNLKNCIKNENIEKKENLDNKLNNEELNDIRKELNTLRSDFENKISNINLNNLKGDTTVQNKEIILDDLKKEINNIKNEVNSKIENFDFSGINKEINHIKNDFENKLKNINLDEVKNEINDNKKYFEEKMKNINLNELKQEMNDHKNDIVNYKNELEKIKNDFSQLKEIQVNITNENNELKKQINKINENLNIKESELKNEIKELKEENKKLKEEKEIIKQEIEKSKKEKEDDNKNGESANKSNEEIMALKDANNKLSEEKKNLEKELAQLKSQISLINEKKKKKEEKFIKEKLNHKFTKSPDKLQIKFDILDSNNIFFIDEFASYISITDKKEYLASGNKKNYNIDIYNLTNNALYKSLEVHKNGTPSIRYFLDEKKKKEYLISADFLKTVIVWDIQNEYNIILNINVNDYKGSILSAILCFNIKTNENEYKDFVITSSDNENEDFTKVYSLTDGSFVKNISNTKKNSSYYLLFWDYNNDNYIIELCVNKISINNLITNENYAELISPPESSHFGGFIYNSNYLCYSSENGYIRIWDLVNKSIFKKIEMKGSCYFEIIPWNEKYIISANYRNNSIDIFDIEKEELFKQIKTSHSAGVRAVKKIFHSIYGECLITSGHDSIIKMWSI